MPDEAHAILSQKYNAYAQKEGDQCSRQSKVLPFDPAGKGGICQEDRHTCMCTCTCKVRPTSSRAVIKCIYFSVHAHRVFPEAFQQGAWDILICIGSLSACSKTSALPTDGKHVEGKAPVRLAAQLPMISESPAQPGRPFPFFIPASHTRLRGALQHHHATCRLVCYAFQPGHAHGMSSCLYAPVIKRLMNDKSCSSGHCVAQQAQCLAASQSCVRPLPAKAQVMLGSILAGKIEAAAHEDGLLGI